MLITSTAAESAILDWDNANAGWRTVHFAKTAGDGGWVHLSRQSVVAITVSLSAHGLLDPEQGAAGGSTTAHSGSHDAV
jgi:hypothetical protein